MLQADCAFLTERMQRLISEQRLGFIATVNADGSPNLSPKGTFVVLDERHVAFADIRSPNTVRNVATDPRVDVSFVDPFSRVGVRLKGRARIVGASDDEFSKLKQRVAGNWQALADRVRAVVVVEILAATELSTPAYDVGSTEDELRTHWTRHFRALQPGGRFIDEPGSPLVADELEG
jgi:predicted pyridoxine 5'-phosphate oxidase superfamily flavin-nucleotide-binding protein